MVFGFGGVGNGAEVEREVLVFAAGAGGGLKKRMGVGAGALSCSAGGLENRAKSHPAGLSFDFGNGAKLKLKAGCFTFGSDVAKLNLGGLDTGGVWSTSSRGVAKLNSVRS